MSAQEKKPVVFGNRNVPYLKGWLTIPQVAERMGVSRQHAHKMATEGTFKTEHRVGNIMVVSEKEIIKIMEADASDS